MSTHPRSGAAPVEPHATGKHDERKLRQPRKRQQQQEEEILSAIRNEGFEPQKIPKWSPGAPGLKADVQARFVIPGPIFQSIITFDKAWERLRRGGKNARIQDE